MKYRNKFAIPVFIIWALALSVYFYLIFLYVSNNGVSSPISRYSGHCLFLLLSYPLILLLIKTSFLKRALICFLTGAITMFPIGIIVKLYQKPDEMIFLKISGFSVELLVLFVVYFVVITAFLLIIGFVEKYINFKKGANSSFLYYSS